MKKMHIVLVAAMLMVVGLVSATPADVKKGGTTPNLPTGDGGQQAWLNHVEAGLLHCVLKPMPEGTDVNNPPEKKNFEQFMFPGPNGPIPTPYWIKCNSFGPK